MKTTVLQLPDPLITADPSRVSGTPCFTGTRVPVKTLFDYLEAGDPLDEFLSQFPDVSRDHAAAVLKASGAAIVLHAVEQEVYCATPEELAAVDEALAQVHGGVRARTADVEAAYARFRK